MHAEMGRKGQAGFVDEDAGVKVRGLSFVYEVQEVINEGKKWGFVLESLGHEGTGNGEGAWEKGVGEDDLRDGVVGERGWKWVGVLCWFGMALRCKGDGQE
jgi:hypothetical protein